MNFVVSVDFVLLVRFSCVYQGLQFLFLGCYLVSKSNGPFFMELWQEFMPIGEPVFNLFFQIKKSVKISNDMQLSSFNIVYSEESFD